ncbi:MAG: TRAP transporter large permease subunit [Planctomycetes bacterium]|nr:TRAP transporter large permease subunit [Planctomycetota bacterium]
MSATGSSAPAASDAAGSHGVVRWFVRGENALVAIVLLAIASVPLIEGLLRALFDASLSGASTIVAHLTLIVGMLGGAVAARENRMLALSTVDTFLKGNLRAFLHAFTFGFAAAVAAFLCVAGVQWIQTEIPTGAELVYGIPTWVVQSVLPLGFGLVAARLLWSAGTTWQATRRRLGDHRRVVRARALRAGRSGEARHAGPDRPVRRDVVRGAGVRDARRRRADPPVGFGRRHRLDPDRPLPPRHEPDPADDPALHARGLPARGGRRVAALDARLPDAVRPPARRTGDRDGAPLRVLHVVHGRVGRHDPGARRTVDARARQRALQGAGRARPDHGRGLARVAPAAVPAADPLRDHRESGDAADVPRWRHAEPALDRAHRRVGDLGRSEGRGPAVCAPPARGVDAARAAGRPRWAAKWELALPFVALGALFSGKATPVEAAAWTALYAAFIEVVVYRDLHPTKKLPGVLVESSLVIGGVLMILGVALGFTNYLVLADFPALALEYVKEHVDSPWTFLLLLNLFLLVVGCLMDIFSAIIVIVPLVVPMGAAYGIDPLHLGIVFLANLELGFLTPPVGMNLFLASYRLKKPMPEVYRAVLPMIAVMLVGVLVITYWPALTTWLPAVFKH